VTASSQARDQILSVAPRARVRLYGVDVSDFDATSSAVDDLTASGQRIDVVINSAGVVREAYFQTLESADFNTVIDTDVSECSM
jgi:3-dehydrosphinganine reductase